MTDLTRLDAFDVELAFYAGQSYGSLTLPDYTVGVLPSLSGWTNVSHLVTYSGNVSYERAGSSLRWRANIKGTGYNAAYFGPGQAVLCLLQVKVGGAVVSPWGLWFLGHVLSGSHEDDYRHGGVWTRALGGTDSYLQRSSAPRLTAGRLNLLSTASVSASSTLATPAVEAGTGEFAGTLVDVSESNTNDGNLNTVWISQEAPRNTTRDEYIGWFDKVFVKPIIGYDQDKLWWIELHLRDKIAAADWFLKTAAGLCLWLTSGREGDVTQEIEGLETGARLIICASQADFEAYTGGANNGATIIETKSWPYQGLNMTWLGDADGTPFTLEPDDDYIELHRNTDVGLQSDSVRAGIVWNPEGTPPTVFPGVGEWEGDAIASGDAYCPPGYGFRRVVSSAVGSKNRASYFAATKNMTPGESYEAQHPEWLLFALEGQTAALATDLAGGETTVELTGTTGLLDSGTAICEADTFTYTGRTATTLTGVSGIGAHSTGAQVYQMIDGVAQTGMPATQLQLFRRGGLPTILQGRIYIKRTGAVAPRTPSDPDPDDPATDDWMTDYDDNVIAISGWSEGNRNGITDQAFNLLGPDGGPRWVMYVLVVIDKMTDYGRAKLNEVKLWASQAQVDYSATGDLDDVSSAGLAEYILQQSGLTVRFTKSVTADTKHLIGEHATAIAPYPQVLDDLARVTGCVCHWTRDGNVEWLPDMWWPYGLNTNQETVTQTLDATYLRGKVAYSGQKPNESGVRVHARTPDGLRLYTASFPETLTAAQQVIEYDGLVLTDVSALKPLTQALYYRAGLHYGGGPQEATFILRGVGEWLRPDQWVDVASDNDTGETATISIAGPFYDLVGWLTENVTWEWGTSGAFKTWKATARCRRYWR